jgi:4-alpha-glucanotransferase
MPTLDRRRSGILLHPTSLPGPHGIGDLGPGAYHFVDWLVAAGQSAWQVLPLNPIGPGDSPYASVSAFAGSPLLVALEPLIEKGWLGPPGAAAGFASHHTDFGRVVPWRMAKLREANTAFVAHFRESDRGAFQSYCIEHAGWLDDYALFMALDEAHQARGTFAAWPQWDPPLARRDPAALATARTQAKDEIAFWKFVQWCFDSQWAALKRYANSKGIRVIGDLPIFVAHHSADCWARPDLYLLDAAFKQKVVAGVPPDYFSETGQRWGNPLYDWEAMKRDGYAWWIERVRRQLQLADVLRVDHFRGFAGCWEIPATCPTAVEGRWAPGPGAALFDALRAGLGELPLIAEDLGVITPDVVELRDRFGFPGMRILQFAFSGDASHAFLPHNYVENCCVYTGTHDNDTAVGWWSSATERERAYAREYLGVRGSDVHWAMMRAASASVARLAVFQMQDVLGLGPEHRMNSPGRTDCWTWRFDWDMVHPDTARHLARMSATFGRAPAAHLLLPEYPKDKPKP